MSFSTCFRVFSRLLVSLFVVALLAPAALTMAAADGEYVGQFDTALVMNPEETERIVFKTTEAGRWQEAGELSASAHFTSAHLINPVTGQAEVLAVLVEEEDEDPVFFVDRDGDNKITAAEKFELKAERNPYLWEALVNVSVRVGLFTSAPIRVEYFQSIKTEKMTDDERWVRQTSEV